MNAKEANRQLALGKTVVDSDGDQWRITGGRLEVRTRPRNDGWCLSSNYCVHSPFEPYTLVEDLTFGAEEGLKMMLDGEVLLDSAPGDSKAEWRWNREEHCFQWKLLAGGSWRSWLAADILASALPFRRKPAQTPALAPTRLEAQALARRQAALVL